MDESLGETSSAAASSDAVTRRLEKKGWSLVESDDVFALVSISRALVDDPNDDDAVADAVESELLNTDLSTVDMRSLPDPSSLCNLAHLDGHKILQVSEVRNISRSSIEDGSTDSGRNRTLRHKGPLGKKSSIALRNFMP
ncbi:hypothetical protein MLD38_037113 [Melastoma candidum]|uniref:Uncharacterized protein n=1 Tax=Melastoma candidum TaxID=119954 RepID=A0ACB9LMH7_9MYRT|nr:hypothetical protein MLD38_037113 [Melastoma candidum]